MFSALLTQSVTAQFPLFYWRSDYLLGMVNSPHSLSLHSSRSFTGDQTTYWKRCIVQTVYQCIVALVERLSDYNIYPIYCWQPHPVQPPVTRYPTENLSLTSKIPCITACHLVILRLFHPVVHLITVILMQMCSIFSTKIWALWKDFKFWLKSEMTLWKLFPGAEQTILTSMGFKGNTLEFSSNKP